MNAIMTKKIMSRVLVKVLFFSAILPLLLTCSEDTTRLTSNMDSYRLQLSAKALFMNSTSLGMMISNDGITLENQVLIEDDAPACGYSPKEGSIEVLKEGVVIKKILKIEGIPVGPARIAMFGIP